MSHFLDPIVSSCQSLFSWQTPPMCAHAKVCFSKIYTVGDFTGRGESLKKSSTLDTLENKKQNKQHKPEGVAGLAMLLGGRCDAAAPTHPRCVT